MVVRRFRWLKHKSSSLTIKRVVVWEHADLISNTHTYTPDFIFDSFTYMCSNFSLGSMLNIVFGLMRQILQRPTMKRRSWTRLFKCKNRQQRSFSNRTQSHVKVLKSSGGICGTRVVDFSNGEQAVWLPRRAFLPHRNTHRDAGAVVRQKGLCGKDYVTQVHVGRGRMRQETLKPTLKLANYLWIWWCTVKHL